MRDLHCYLELNHPVKPHSLRRIQREEERGKFEFFGADGWEPPTALRFVRETDVLCEKLADIHHDWGTAYVYADERGRELIVPGRFRATVDEHIELGPDPKPAKMSTLCKIREKLRAAQAASQEAQPLSAMYRRSGRIEAFEECLKLLKEDD